MTSFERAEVETLLGRPVLRLRRPPLPERVIDLDSGAAKEIDFDLAQSIARDSAPRFVATDAPIAAAEEIEDDQWTVGRYRADRPLFRFAFADPAATTLYVSGTSGRSRAAHDRLAAVLELARRSPALDLSDGTAQQRTVVEPDRHLGVDHRHLSHRARPLSRHRANQARQARFALSRPVLLASHDRARVRRHHPDLRGQRARLDESWGFLDSRRGGGERARIEGAAMRWGAIKASLEAVKGQAPHAVSLATAPMAGRLYWLATDGAGQVTRIDAAGHPAPLTAADLAAAALRIGGANAIASQEMLAREDAYYFAHHDDVVLPVYRIILNDADATRFYLDPTTGALLRRADADARWQRWLFSGLHRLDFTAGLRARPLWDLVMIVLLVGGIGLSATGVYLAIRRIRVDVAALARFGGAVRTRFATPEPATTPPES